MSKITAKDLYVGQTVWVGGEKGIITFLYFCINSGTVYIQVDGRAGSFILNEDPLRLSLTEPKKPEKIETAWYRCTRGIGSFYGGQIILLESGSEFLMSGNLEEVRPTNATLTEFEVV